MALRSVPQLGFDETPIDDDDLEQALEERDRLRVLSSEHRKAFDEAHEKASAEIAKQELPDGKVIRVGRFRISRNAVSARSVAFEAKATTRVRITVVGEDE